MKNRKKALGSRLLVISALISFPSACIADALDLTLQRGLLADYGATPWFTTSVHMGASPMQFALDTGTNLFWATLDICRTEACKNHTQVNTSQPGFKIVENPNYPKNVNFGPWGSMLVDLAEVPVNVDAQLYGPMRFDGSIDYQGDKFRYLAWGGGIGLPSESSSVNKDINNFFLTAYRSHSLPEAAISFYTNANEKKGVVILGGDDPSLYDPSTQVELSAKKSQSSGLQYLWGTELVKGFVGTKEVNELEGKLFYLDSGSSRFKGDQEYVKPILEQLLTYKDSEGNSIFEAYDFEPGTGYTGIKFANGKSPADFPTILPDFSIVIGNTCNARQNSRVQISLSPEQYAYKVEIGEGAGEWVIAFHVLPEVDGLLVGSTFMDLFYTRFEFKVDADENLNQGNMYLYKKKSGEQPSGYRCVSH